MDIAADEAGLKHPLLPVTVALKQGVRITFLPPPSNRADPLAIVELGRAAEVRNLFKLQLLRIDEFARAVTKLHEAPEAEIGSSDTVQF